jgi:hypothetical protein
VTWKVHQLRDALIDMTVRKPETANLEVCIRVSDDAEAVTLVGGLTSAAIDPGCTEIPMLVLDGQTDAESDATEELREEGMITPRRDPQDETRRGPETGRCGCGAFSSRLNARGQCQACAERACE